VNIQVHYYPTFITHCTVNQSNTHTYTCNCFKALFLGLPGRAGSRRDLRLDFRMHGKITEADTSTIRVGATPSGLITAHLHFYAGCPSYHNPPTLSWLGTGTKYAGLHPQWRGCTVYQSNTPKIPHAHIHHFYHTYATWSPDFLLPLLKNNLCRFLSGQMPFLSLNQQCQSTEDNQTHTHSKMSTGFAANMRDVPVNDSMSSSSSSSWRGRGCSMTFPSSSTVSTSTELGYNSYTAKSIHSTLKNITVQVSINLHGSTLFHTVEFQKNCSSYATYTQRFSSGKWERKPEKEPTNPR